MLDLNDREYEIPCPKCGAQMKKTFNEIRQDPTLVCPDCHAITKIDTDKVRKALDPDPYPDPVF